MNLSIKIIAFLKSKCYYIFVANATHKVFKGFKMEVKKILATFLIAGFIGIDVAPVYSADVSASTKLTKKQKKDIQEKASKLDCINLDWWEGFDDEYLNEYILKAVENNHDLKISTLKVEEARQNVKVQFASELPSLSVGAAPAITKLPGTTSTSGAFAIPVIASYELDIFLKNHDKTKSMKKIYEATQLGEKASYLAIVSAVGATYYNIVRADKLIELQKNIVADRKMIFELMQLRHEEGITSTSDLVQAEKNYILADSDLTDLEKVRDNLLTSFAVLIGESPENISEIKRISYDKMAKKKAVPEQIPSEIIVSRPDYMAAEKMIEKAGIDVRVAKKEFLPSFNILGLLAMVSMTGSSMSWSSALAAGAVSGMLPVFTGGRRIANLKIQKNRYEQMLEEYQKTNINAIKEVNDALSSLKYDTTRYQKGLAAYNNEKTDFKFTNDKYNQGVISKLDLKQKEEVLLSTQKLVVSDNIDTYISQIGLYKATAGAKY